MTNPQIKIEGQDTEGKLAQEFHVMHTPNEFLLTILEVIPQMEFDQGSQPPRLKNAGLLQKVVGRFGMSPAAFKKLLTVAKRNLDQYESKFGEIAINPPEGMQ